MIRQPGWHTVAEVAQMWGVCTSTVYTEIREGRLRAFMPRMRTRGFLVSDEELARYVAEELVPVAKEAV